MRKHHDYCTKLFKNSNLTFDQLTNEVIALNKSISDFERIKKKRRTPASVKPDQRPL